MRLAAAMIVFVCLSACGMTASTPQDYAGGGDAWRQHQAQLDADAIMQGMAQARERASQLARSAR